MLFVIARLQLSMHFGHVEGGCLFTELGFRVGFRVRFRVGFSSWIFELGFFGWIFMPFFLVGFPIDFQWFYTTYFVNGVAHRLDEDYYLSPSFGVEM